MCNVSRNVNLLQRYFSIWFAMSMVGDAKIIKASIYNFCTNGNLSTIDWPLQQQNLIYEMLTAVLLKIQVIWAATRYDWPNRSWRFAGWKCLHVQGQTDRLSWNAWPWSWRHYDPSKCRLSNRPTTEHHISKDPKFNSYHLYPYFTKRREKLRRST